MRLKFNYVKMDGFLNLITFLLEHYPYENKGEKLLQILVDQIRIKVRNRLDSRNPKDSYSITITDSEALALDLWMSQMEIGIMPNTYIYEATVVKDITNEIDKTLG